MSAHETVKPKEIVSVLKTVLRKGSKPVALHEPLFEGREREYVNECIDSGYVSSVGSYVNQFEAELCRFTGAVFSAAVVNGTSALNICLKLTGVQPKDEVLIPALTFVAAANAVCYCGAAPHFVDSDMDSLCVDAYKLDAYLKNAVKIRNKTCYNKRTGCPIRALVAVHTFGHPADIDSILRVCEDYELKLIEDAAESLGSYYKNTHTGKFGKLAAISFNGNKIVTTGGGGAILTDDEELYREAKHLTTTAKLPHRWTFTHDKVGYNYRMPNINAALGCAQLEQINKFLSLKRALAEEYRKAFTGVSGIRFFTEPCYAKSNCWLNTLILPEGDTLLRDSVLEETNRRGIATRPAWTLMSRLPMFESCPRMDLSIAESLERRIINIPSGAALGKPFLLSENSVL